MKDDIGGSSPDSFHVTERVFPPPGIELPAAGDMNSTSAMAKGAKAVNRKRDVTSISGGGGYIGDNEREVEQSQIGFLSRRRRQIRGRWWS